MNWPKVKSLKLADSTVGVEDWWEHHHRAEGNYKLWLTGSRPEGVWYPLRIDGRLRPGAVVLNIGVGLGHCTRALVDRGCVVHALDIAPAALDRVASWVAKTWMPSDLVNLPKSTFDVAISHLVAQHMRDEQLDEQFRAVIPALKHDGVFALQFAYAFDDTRNDLASVPDEALKGGGVDRTLAHVSQMVDKAGGMVVWADRIGLFAEHQSGWYAVHITRRDFQATTSIVRSPWSVAQFAMLRIRTVRDVLLSSLRRKK